MNSINLVALPKKFSFMRWRLFGAFCQNTYIYTYIMCIFTVQGVLENRQCHDMGLKLKYMISIIIAAIPKICFLLWGGASCPNTYIPLFKVYFILWVCVYSIIDVYDLKQSNFLGHTLWWKFTLNEYIYVFGTKGHQKAQPHKPFFWESNNNDWSHIFPFLVYVMALSIFLDTLYGENTIQIRIYVFGTKGHQKAQPNKLFLGRITIMIEVI